MELADHPDWEGLKQDVSERIDALRAAWQSMPAGPLLDAIRRDLCLPNLKLLAAFCAAVSLEEEDET